MNWLRRFCLALVTLPALAAPIPAEDFFRPPEFSGPELSPDGKHVAFILHEGWKGAIGVLNLASKKLSVIEPAKKETANGLTWVSNERLVFSLAEERETWLALLTGTSLAAALKLAESWKGEGDTPGRLAAPLALVRDLSLLSSGGGADIMNEDLREPLASAAEQPPANGWDAAFRELLSISRMPPQPQKRLMLEAFFFGLHGKG